MQITIIRVHFPLTANEIKLKTHTLQDRLIGKILDRIKDKNYLKIKRNKKKGLESKFIPIFRLVFNVSRLPTREQ